MSTLFAIDTAGERCTLALARDGTLDCVAGAPGQTHLEHVMPLVERLFERHGLRPAQCDAFAFGSGPGSFTGLRVACTIVQGLAYGAGRPVIAVGNLQALAAQAAGAVDAAAGQGAGRRVLAAIDARMGQAYVAVLQRAGEDWNVCLAPSLIDAAALATLSATWAPDLLAGDSAWLTTQLGRHDAASGATNIAANSAANSVANSAASGAAGVPMAPVVLAGVVRDARVDAGVIARLALLQLACGAVLRPEQAVPQYVRDEVAKTVAQRRAAQLAGAT